MKSIRSLIKKGKPLSPISLFYAISKRATEIFTGRYYDTFEFMSFVYLIQKRNKWNTGFSGSAKMIGKGEVKETCITLE